MKVTKSKEWYYWASKIAWITALMLCVIPTVITGAIKLPLFVTNDASTTLTGSFILVLVCAAYPIIKGLLQLLKSPSAWLILWLLFGVTFLLYNIEHATMGAIVVVLLVAAIGNTMGAILFAISKAWLEKWKFMDNPNTVKV